MSGRRLLVVDDELEVTDLLKESFQQKGVEVLIASTGEEAISLIQSEKPALVLLDMRLGAGLSGMEVLRRARAAQTQAQFIVVTAADDQNLAHMAIGLGATDYITKPFSLSDLERVVLPRLG